MSKMCIFLDIDSKNANQEKNIHQNFDAGLINDVQSTKTTRTMSTDSV